MSRLRQLRDELRTVLAGATLRDRLRILRILSHAHLQLGRGRRLLGWIPAGDGRPREVRLRSGRTLLVRPQDAIVLYEHQGADVYDLRLPTSEVRTIVDLGANVGLAALALAAHHPGARLVCVEPVAESRALLEANLARNGVAAEIVGAAVVGAPGRYGLAPAAFPAAIRVVADAGGEVEGVTLAALLDRVGVDEVDLLKIDIEGAERGVFADAGTWAHRVRAIVGELHDGLTLPEAAAMLAPHGFRALPQRHGVAAFQRVAAIR